MTSNSIPTPPQFSDHRAPRFPVSIKGIVHDGFGRVALLKNERDEWELPGGKLEPGEQPIECVAREISEELGIAIEIDRLIDTWLYNIQGKVEVVIITYLCKSVQNIDAARLSHEHKELAVFEFKAIANLPMPAGYINSIVAALGKRQM